MAEPVQPPCHIQSLQGKMRSLKSNFWKTLHRPISAGSKWGGVKGTLGFCQQGYGLSSRDKNYLTPHLRHAVSEAHWLIPGYWNKAVIESFRAPDLCTHRDTSLGPQWTKRHLLPPGELYYPWWPRWRENSQDLGNALVLFGGTSMYKLPID